MIKISRISSAQIVASIDDLLLQILLYLPIKSLVRFKLVSKRWHSLITNPDFCLQRNPNPNPALGLVVTCTDLHIKSQFEYIPFSDQPSTPFPKTFKKLNFVKDRHSINILQSCNGFLLCSSHRDHERSRKYYVYNPTTKRYTKLPKLTPQPAKVADGVSLAFDPAISPHHKVVCVLGFESSPGGDYLHEIEMYSSDRGPWRTCTEPFISNVDFSHGVYWNGAIHWISNAWSGESLYFDVHYERLETMPMPPIPSDWEEWRSNFYFGASCDHLQLVEIHGPEIEFNVYEMKRDYSEWFIKFRVDLSAVVTAFPQMIRGDLNPTDWDFYAFSVFSVIRGKEEEDSFLVIHIPGMIIRYNLVHRTFEKIHEFEDAEVGGFFRFYNTKAFEYIESLCCV